MKTTVCLFSIRWYSAAQDSRVVFRKKSWPILALLLISVNCVQANIIAWTGNSGSAWNNAANWSPQTVPGAGDDVQIGVVAYQSQPVISGSFQCSSLTIGSRQAVLITIVAGGTLTVTGALALDHSPDNIIPSATITGSGSLSCGSLNVGDGTFSKVLLTKTTSLVSTLANLTVSGNISLNSSTIFLLSGGLAHNNSILSLQGGELTVNGQVTLTNTLPFYLVGLLNNFTPSSSLHVDVSSGQNPHLKVLGNPALTISNPVWDTVDYYYYTVSSPSGISTIEYGGANQVVATGATAGLNISPAPYDDLLISGSGTKTTESASGDSLFTTGDLLVTSSTLDLATNHASLAVGGNFINTGTVRLAKAIFLGANFTNDNSLTTGTDTVRFWGSSQILADSTSSGTQITNVQLRSSTKTISKGSFIIPAGGGWKVADDSTKVGISPNASLVFRADTTGLSTMTFASVAPAGGGQTMALRRTTLATARSLSPKTKIAATKQPKLNLAPLALKKVQPVPAIHELLLTFQLTGAKVVSDPVMVRFARGAAGRYVPYEDRINPPSKMPLRVFTYSSDGRELALNTLPPPPATSVVQLYSAANYGGTYSWHITGASAFKTGYILRLKDGYTGKVYDLSRANNIPFSISIKKPKSFGKRFLLTIQKQP